jgi:hypothetical protein
MSLSINRLLDLAGKQDERKEMLGKNPDIPERYNSIKGMQMSSDKNMGNDPSTYDKFGEVMRQDRQHRYNATNLYLDIHKKNGVALPIYTLEGYLDPGNRRRMSDPMHAPPPDMSVGTERQIFETGPNEDVAHDNVSLVQLAHQNYNKFINRYNIPTR